MPTLTELFVEGVAGDDLAMDLFNGSWLDFHA